MIKHQIVFVKGKMEVVLVYLGHMIDVYGFEFGFPVRNRIFFDEI